MSMEMKTYHCQDPADNPPPLWLRRQKPAPAPAEPMDPVAQFKQNPDSFFPDWVRKK